MKTIPVNLGIEFCGVKFSNPFILSAAPPTDDLDMLKRGLEMGWAGAVLKTTSVEKNKVELVYPMISGLSFENKKVVGMGNIDLISEHHIDLVEKRVEALKKEFGDERVIAASIMGAKKEDWQGLVKRLKAAGVDVIECSFSCPQGSMGEVPGAMLAQSVPATEMVTRWVKDAARKTPVVIKITPMVADIVAVANAVKKGGADAICASNTIPSLMGIDIENFIPNPNVAGKTTYSGLSGPAIKPITLKVISELSKTVGLPITGTGGAVNWIDALEFILCGATTVQFCTAVMHYGYDIIEDLCEGLAFYMEEKGISKVKNLIGKSLPYIVGHDDLSRKNRVTSNIDLKKCVRCGLCYYACQDGGHQAIELGRDRKPEVDEEKCFGCGLCQSACPIDGCIELKESEKPRKIAIV